MKRAETSFTARAARLAACAWLMTAGAAGWSQSPGAPGRPSGASPEAPGIDTRQIGLDQKLKAQIPLDLEFTNERGKTVKLAQYFTDKPVVLALVWYKCPGICGVELEAMTKTFGQLKDPLIGRDYEVVTVSINPNETHEMAAAKKAGYLSTLGLGSAERGWHFLVGAEANIKKLAASVGYRYVYDKESEQYVHPAGLIIATPSGSVSRYLFGLEYPPRDMRFALNDASHGKTGSLVERAIILTCYHYDPATGRYTVAVTKILQWAGVLTIAIIGTFILLMVRFERRRARAAAAAVPAELGGKSV